LFVAHLPRHPHSLAHAARIGAVTDRAAVAKIFVGSARSWKAREVMLLNDPLVAVTLGGRAHVDRVAGLEHVGDCDRLAEFQLALAALLELGGANPGRNLTLRKMTARGTTHTAQLLLAEGDLHGFVTVGRFGLDLCD